MKYEIFMDLDDTTVNFSKVVIDRYNRDFNENFDYRDNKSYWWKDVPNHSMKYFKNLLLQPLLFFEAEPFKDAVKYIRELIVEGYRVNIVTKPEFLSQYSMNEKIYSILKWLPMIDIENEVYFCGDKSRLAAPGRILVDDNIEHLKAWEKNGGIAIAYNQGWNQEWEGKRVYNHEELYELIHKLSYNTKIDLDLWKNLRN